MPSALRNIFLDLRFLISLLVAASLSSCGFQEIKREAPAVNVLKAGVTFRINLPEDHATGSLWQLNRDFDKAVVEDLNAVWHGNEKGIDFNFKTVKAGQTTLTLILRTYKDTLIVKNFIIKITE